MNKKRLYYKWQLIGIIVLTFVIFTFVSVALKPVFMLFNHSIYKDCDFKDYLNVVWHGLPMDMSVAGYLTVIPALLLILSVWFEARPIRCLQKFYFFLVALLFALISMLDAVLYGYWGFRIDTTPLFYFFSSPKDALASVSLWFIAAGVVALILLTFLFYYIFKRMLASVPEGRELIKTRWIATVFTLVTTALLILPIRGSLTTSTMNLGRVYYSSNQHLNHAAINPCFSLLASYINDGNVKGQYRFMKDEEADKLFAQIRDTTKQGGGTDVQRLLNTERPNIIMVVLESFSAKIMKSLGGTPNVAVNMDRFANEGVLFTHFYANSFRTDRGLVAILAGYPAQPTMSIMKYPAKTESLPMFTKELKQVGYDLKYYYGGDADFTNMRSFLTTAGFEKIVSDADFSIKLRLSKWGVPDQYVFDRAIEDIRSQQVMPYLKVIQTSSSHEPFDVPYQKLNNKILNAFAYTDYCLGKFVEQLKKLPSWSNTLLVLVPDHLGCYPENIDNYSSDRYHIPLVLLGGALKTRGQIPTYGSQADIAATILSQLGMRYDAFTFSKDMLNPKVPHFGFSTVPNALMMITADNTVIFDCESNTTIVEEGSRKGHNLPYGKAYLQKLYDDIAQR